MDTSCLHFLTITNNAAVIKMGIQIFLQDLAFSFSLLGCITRSGIARSYSYSVFKFLRNYLTVFHSSYTNLYSYSSVHILVTLLFYEFFC